MHILGLSAFYHDSAAALIRDGEIVAACQEERFTRKKADADFPAQSVAYCLKAGALKMADIDEVVFYDKPFIKFERLLETFVATAPRGFGPFLKAMPVWLKQKLWMKDLLREELGYEGRILFGEHHESHAASAFYPSPFEEAAVLTVDGVGEWATTSMSYGHGHALDPLWQQDFPHSLGLLYSAFTYYTGFKVNSGEYKVMGLAPYGEPKHVQTILDHVIDLKDDGSFRLNMEYFNFHTGLTMTSAKFHDLFGGPPREPETKLTPREMDLARSVQDVTELVMLRMARHAKKVTGAKNLCLAGGVALNCVANGKVLRDGAFERVWIQPAAGDAGGALGTALAAWHIHHDKPRTVQPGPSGYDDAMRGSYLGPAYSNDEIAAFMAKSGAVATRVADSELASVVAAHIADEKVIGWFQGRMEYGPRALGARSILGDARSPSMQKQMNLKIKFRESFRPFAPSVLEERVDEYFTMRKGEQSPYMLQVAPVRESIRINVNGEANGLFGIDKLKVKRSTLPAITHVDYSARVQTVDPDRHGRYYTLLRAFERKTGCPVLINTSFNVRGEPIVCTPEDAYRCFMGTNMDVLVLERNVLLRTEQPGGGEVRNEEYLAQFKLD
jgi:carbamoyltransferase